MPNSYEGASDDANYKNISIAYRHYYVVRMCHMA